MVITSSDSLHEPISDHILATCKQTTYSVDTPRCSHQFVVTDSQKPPSIAVLCQTVFTPL